MAFHGTDVTDMVALSSNHYGKIAGIRQRDQLGVQWERMLGMISDRLQGS